MIVKNVESANFYAYRNGLALVFFLIETNSFLASITAVLQELHRNHWVMLFLYVFFIILIHTLIVLLVLKTLRNKLLILCIMTSLAVMNLYLVYMILLEQYLTQDVSIKILLVFSVSIVFSLIFIFSSRNQYNLKRINLLLVCSLFASFFMNLYNNMQSELSPVSNKEIVENIKFTKEDIKFTNKPDIHIVAVDALIPPSLANKLLGLPSVPYEALLLKEDVILFNNAFASRVPTKESLNSIMRLAHQDFYNEARYDYFSGMANSPITQIFNSNGYEISNGNANDGLGTKGIYVSNYYPNSTSLQNSSLCDLVATDRKFVFYGICGFINFFDKYAPKTVWSDKLLEIINESVDNKSKPQLTFHYAGILSHTSSSFQTGNLKHLSNYKDYYLQRSIVFTNFLEKLIRIIKGSNKNTIFILLGDHGTFISRSADFNNNKEFIVQDQHGILAAVMQNRSTCSSKELNYYNNRGYSTPERVISGIIRCLSEKKSLIDNFIEFGEPYDFKNYLYE